MAAFIILTHIASTTSTLPRSGRAAGVIKQFGEEICVVIYATVPHVLEWILLIKHVFQIF